MNEQAPSRTIRAAMLGPGNRASFLAQGLSFHAHAFGMVTARDLISDRLDQHLGGLIDGAAESKVDVAAIQKRIQIGDVVSFLPVDPQGAADSCSTWLMGADCGPVDCMPVILASRPCWSEQSHGAGLPIVGSDTEKEVSATIGPRSFSKLFDERIIHLDQTVQLNVGGNADFDTMLGHERLNPESFSKTRIGPTQLHDPPSSADICVRSNDCVDWLSDCKCASIRLEDTGFSPTSLHLDPKLGVQVQDASLCPRSLIDAIWRGKLGLDWRSAEASIKPSEDFIRSPLVQINGEIAGGASAEAGIAPMRAVQ